MHTGERVLIFFYSWYKASEVIGRALKTNKTLMRLSLFGNGMGTEGSVKFAEGLAGNTSLKRLDLGLNNLQDEGAKYIAAALELGNLETLNLSQNAIGTRGTNRLAQAISSGNLLILFFSLMTN
jgi:Ran GTPase-activating protein (RanGAP) involved in mRNA processing and transport